MKINNECCSNCKYNLKLLKFDYSQDGSCKHSEYPGFVCTALSHEGVAVHMCGGDPQNDICEMYIPVNKHLRMIDTIRNMTDKELADFLIIYGEKCEVDYDFDDNLVEKSVSCWYTPFRVFDGWLSKNDVLEELKIILQQESEVINNENR
jgi:hypothetical protein